MKKILVPLLLSVVLLSFTGCSNKELDAANEAVTAYNTEAKSFNESIASYNTDIQEIVSKNQELQDAVDVAQEILDKGETPFDEETTTTLKDAMTKATDAMVTVPDEIESYPELTVDEKAKKDELVAITEQANGDVETMKAFTFPDVPEVPDYSEEIQLVSDAQLAYEDSVQSLKQITAPTDDFVQERLKKVDTITDMDAVTENHDPNGQLNKQGGYIGCIYFRDSQVDWSDLYVDSGEDNVIDVGCDGGGAVEVYKTADEAKTRDEYLATFDGTGMSSGSHYVYGTIIVRTSDELSGTQQQELTDKIVNALTEIED